MPARHKQKIVNVQINGCVQLLETLNCTSNKSCSIFGNIWFFQCYVWIYLWIMISHVRKRFHYKSRKTVLSVRTLNRSSHLLNDCVVLLCLLLFWKRSLDIFVQYRRIRAFSERKRINCTRELGFLSDLRFQSSCLLLPPPHFHNSPKERARCWRKFALQIIAHVLFMNRTSMQTIQEDTRSKEEESSTFTFSFLEFGTVIWLDEVYESCWYNLTVAGCRKDWCVTQNEL